MNDKSEMTGKYVALTPAADIVEGGQGWRILLDMPGVSEETLEVKLENRLLEVSGESRITHHDRTVRYERSFQLSDEIDQPNIHAGLKDGVLELMLPKSESSRPRKIAVLSA